MILNSLIEATPLSMCDAPNTRRKYYWNFWAFVHSIQSKNWVTQWTPNKPCSHHLKRRRRKDSYGFLKPVPIRSFPFCRKRSRIYRLHLDMLQRYNGTRQGGCRIISFTAYLEAWFLSLASLSSYSVMNRSTKQRVMSNCDLSLAS